MSRSRRENNVRRKRVEKRERQSREQAMRQKAATDEWRKKQRASGMPPDVYALAQALGCR